MYINFNMEKEMNKLKKLGFKKVPGTEPGFVMYELNPAELLSVVSCMIYQSRSQEDLAPKIPHQNNAGWTKLS